jgi:hypothetical protein
MADEGVLSNINTLVDEEHELLKRAEQEQGLDASAHNRLEEIKVELDRCWDLLRRRRALRSAGENPDDAELLDAKTVEDYLG